MKSSPRAQLIILCCLALIGCQPEPAAEAPAEPLAGESERANAFFDKAFNQRLALNPMDQSYLGIKDDYDKWDDFSDQGYQQQYALLQAQREELIGSIDPSQLHSQDKLSYQLFLKEIDDAQLRHPYRYHNYPVNQMGGYQAQLPAFMINIHRIQDGADAEAYISRLENWSTAFDQIIEGLRIRAEKGIGAPRFVYTYVLEDSRNVIAGRPFDDSETDSLLLADFREKVRALDLNAGEEIALIRLTKTISPE